jgi:hypothetical protein
MTLSITPRHTPAPSKLQKWHAHGIFASDSLACKHMVLTHPSLKEQRGGKFSNDKTIYHLGLHVRNVVKSSWASRSLHCCRIVLICKAALPFITCARSVYMSMLPFLCSPDQARTGGGLVEEEDGGCRDKRACNVQPPLLAARQPAHQNATWQRPTHLIHPTHSEFSPAADSTVRFLCTNLPSSIRGKALNLLYCCTCWLSLRAKVS